MCNTYLSCKSDEVSGSGKWSEAVGVWVEIILNNGECLMGAVMDGYSFTQKFTNDSGVLSFQ